MLLKIMFQESVIVELVQLKAEFHEWTDIRTETILKLRSIADHVDTVTHRTGLAKIVGSGGGAVAGGLTLLGGALTMASLGAMAISVLLAGIPAPSNPSPWILLLFFSEN